MVTPPIRDILVLNDMQPGTLSADAHFVGPDLRIPTLGFIYTRVPIGGTYQLTSQPETGFTLQLLSPLVGPPPRQQFTQWEATTAGATTIPLSWLVMSMLFKSPTPFPNIDFATWLDAHGWQLRCRWPLPGNQPGPWSDWAPPTE